MMKWNSVGERAAPEILPVIWLKLQSLQDFLQIFHEPPWHLSYLKLLQVITTLNSSVVSFLNSHIYWLWSKPTAKKLTLIFLAEPAESEKYNCKSLCWPCFSQSLKGLVNSLNFSKNGNSGDNENDVLDRLSMQNEKSEETFLRF